MAALTITAFSQDFTTDVFQVVVSLSDSSGQPVEIDVNGITALVTDSGNSLTVQGVGNFMRGFSTIALAPAGFTLSPGNYTLALAINNFGRDHCQTVVKATIPPKQDHT